MKNSFLLILSIICFINNLYSQVTLNADGVTETYTLINSVLAPGYNVVETCDQCGDHAAFGDHITQNYDSDLASNVFQFHIHNDEDTDRCKPANTDRQRNEIKTYDKSPDNLLGTEGETVQYKWKFKLPTGFEPSPSFTHIHQLKSVNDDHDNMPMYTFTLRSSSGGVFRIRYAEFGSQVDVAEVPLSSFLGIWVDVTETITYTNPGSYSLVINKVSDGSNILTYSNTNNNWRNVVTEPGVTIDDVFIRPKWGVYRKILDSSDNPLTELQDEIVLFADFSIEENPTLSVASSNIKNQAISMFPNPSKGNITFTTKDSKSFDYYYVYNNLGQKLTSKNTQKTFDTSSLVTGTYYIVFYKNDHKLESHKLVIN